MNNALFFEDTESLQVDTTMLRRRQVELGKILEAIQELVKNKDWQILNSLIFEGMVERLEKSLQVEAKKNELLPAEIYRLQGQLLWARRYNNLYKLAEAYKIELNNITKKLNENANI